MPFRHETFRRPALCGLPVLSAALVTCIGETVDPVEPDPVGPGAPNIGRLVHSTPEIFEGASLAWIEPGERLVFRSWDGERAQMKLLDVATGEAEILEHAPLFPGPRPSGWPLEEGSNAQLVADSDGETIYYVDFVRDGAVVPALLSATVVGGSPETLDPSVGHGGLALARDGSWLAYSSASSDTAVVLTDSGIPHTDTVVALNLVTMESMELPAVTAPLSFSPDGTELLVLTMFDGLARIRLADGAIELLELEPFIHPVAVRWDASGIRVLGVEVPSSALSGFTVTSDAGSAARLSVGDPEGVVDGGVLAETGEAYAIWARECLLRSFFGDCAEERITVHLGQWGTGEATPLGSADFLNPEDYPGSIDGPVPWTSAAIFSPDGGRVYDALDGMLYVVDVR